MTSHVEIANMALTHLGNTVEIANFTERTPEAKALNRVYETARKKSLRDFKWPFATVIGEDLGLVETAPNIEWAFSYRYPSDCFFFRRILSGTRNEPPDAKVPYRIGRDGTGLLLFTDMSDASAEYTINANDPAKYPEDFALALSYLVAFFAAPRITRGDPFKLRQSLYQLYQSEINNSNANARNEENLDMPPVDDFTRARR